MKTILFVGSNPSRASAYDMPFYENTRSSKILTSWIQDVQGVKMYINVMNKKTDNNRPLKKSEITANIDQLANSLRCINPDRVIALGKTAATALTLLRVEFLEMPHPSGRNRKLNDKDYLSKKVQELVQYCNQTSPADSEF